MRTQAPARVVSWKHGEEIVTAPLGETHAWAEAHLEGLGWVGFDPTHQVCPTEAYVRVCAGLDARLNEHGYIVPGLGDAGDRLFGTKVEEASRIPGAAE